jgi:hypothetical protein
MRVLVLMASFRWGPGELALASCSLAKPKAAKHKSK